MKAYQRLTPQGKTFFQQQNLVKKSLYQEGEIEDYTDVVEEPFHGPVKEVPKRASARAHAHTIPSPNPTTQQVNPKPQTRPMQQPRQVSGYRDTDPVMYTRKPSYTYTERVPVKKKKAKPKEQGFIGKIITVVILLAVIGFSLHVIIDWIGEKITDFQYGNPRTQQIDYVVGHNDSQLSPSHFIALNYRGQIEVIEIQGGDPSKEKVYIGPNIINNKIPVRVGFKDVNNDGKPDMILHIEDGTDHVVIMMNTGEKFDPKAPIPSDAAEKIK